MKSSNNYRNFNNNWNFKEGPVRRGISIERISGTPIDIFISNKKLKCVKYRMKSYDFGSEIVDLTVNQEIPYLDLYLSKHLTIPYKIVDKLGNKVFQIKYFNYLVDSER